MKMLSKVFVIAGLAAFVPAPVFAQSTDLIKQRAKDRAERVRREAEERRQARARHPIPTWQGYLEREAANGNEAALTALRGRMQRRAHTEARLIEAENAEEARHILYRHLRPAVRRDGRLIYRTTDGGIVSDEARRVRVSEPTAGAVFLALSLAADRFGHRPLMVLGTDEFRGQVAKLAAIEGLNVRFSDGVLEKQRLSMRNDRARGVAHRRGAAHSTYDRQDINTERDHGR